MNLKGYKLDGNVVFTANATGYRYFWHWVPTKGWVLDHIVDGMGLDVPPEAEQANTEVQLDILVANQGRLLPALREALSVLEGVDLGDCGDMQWVIDEVQSILYGIFEKITRTTTRDNVVT